MRITKVSPLSGKENHMDLPITESELSRFQCGEHAQNVWPHLNSDQREFLISGITPEEWEKAFKEEEEEPEP